MALKEAMKVVAERRQDYGDQLTGFCMTARYWSALFGIPVTAEQVALAFILNKVSRESMAHKADNLVDIAGYAEVIEQLRTESDTRFSMVNNSIPRMSDEELRQEFFKPHPASIRHEIEARMVERFLGRDAQ